MRYVSISDLFKPEKISNNQRDKSGSPGILISIIRKNHDSVI